MDEIDIKSALRRYVTAGAPPFPLAASTLMAKGRQRRLLRVGVACLSSGAMLLTTAIFTSALTNPFAPLYPGLNVTGCDRPLPVWVQPTASVEPAPSIDISATPASLGPSRQMVEPTPHSAVPTPQPAEPTQRLEVVAHTDPSEIASQFPTDSAAEVTRWPSVAPEGPLPKDPDPARIAAMQCYVKGAALMLFPNSSFAPASEPPMQIVRWPELDFTTGWQPIYSIRAVVVDGMRRRDFSVQVAPRNLQSAEPEPQISFRPPEIRQLGNGRTAYLHRPYEGFVTVNTEHSMISVYSDGQLLTEDQAIALACGRELDIFGQSS